jgi:tetratricopeptide (TPR) repeat protein
VKEAGFRRWTLAACLFLGFLARAAAWGALDAILPLERLYVDEEIYSSGSMFGEDGAFDRPPGQFLLCRVLLAPGVEAARYAMSFISLIPALSLAFSARGRWGAAAALALSVEPSLVLAGLQLLPEAPAAAFISMALARFARGGTAGPGFLTGIASLFRPEILLAAVLLPFSRCGGRRTAFFAGSALAPVLPLIAVNMFSGSGPVLAANGAENLWLGSSLDLLRIPPGMEFEQLMAVGPARGDAFLCRWASAVIADPAGTAVFAARKLFASLELPGPGRNVDSRDIYTRTGLAWLLPLTGGALCLGISRVMKGIGSAGLAEAGIASLLLSAAIFFPAERYRAAQMPFLFFLAASRPPDRKDAIPSAGVAVAVILCSVFPLNSTRPGLNYLIRAGKDLDYGFYGEAMADLRSASLAGFEGADLHNLRAVAMAAGGDSEGSVNEFEAALEAAPTAPTLWRNYAVALYSTGRTGEARQAASRAISLRPSLRSDLAPLLR